MLDAASFDEVPEEVLEGVYFGAARFPAAPSDECAVPVRGKP